MSSENGIHTAISCSVFSYLRGDGLSPPATRPRQVAVSTALLRKNKARNADSHGTRPGWTRRSVHRGFCRSSPPIIAGAPDRRRSRRHLPGPGPADRSAPRLYTQSWRCLSCRRHLVACFSGPGTVSVPGRLGPDGCIRLASRARLDGEGQFQSARPDDHVAVRSHLLRVRLESVRRDLQTVLVTARIHRWKSTGARVGADGAGAGAVDRVGDLE